MKSRVGLVVAGLLAAAIPSMSWAAVSVTVGNASGKPGDSVNVDVTVNIDGGDVVGSLDITTAWQDSKVRIPPKGTSTTNADCTGNPDLEFTLAQFRFVPNACTGDACTGVKSAILGRETGYNSTAIFYTCKVNIAADTAPGMYQITVPDATYAKLDGTEIAITGTAGTVTVATDTPTPVAPTATSTPVAPTATRTSPAATATNTAPPVPTRTHTAIPTVTSTPVFGADDGCQMNSQSSSNALLMLLMPVAFVAVMRRRNR